MLRTGNNSANNHLLIKDPTTPNCLPTGGWTVPPNFLSKLSAILIFTASSSLVIAQALPLHTPSLPPIKTASPGCETSPRNCDDTPPELLPALIEESRGNLRASANLLQSEYQNPRRSPATAAHLGRVLFASGRFSEAKEPLNDARVNFPDDPRILEMVARNNYRLKDLQSSLVAFQSIKSLDNTSTDALIDYFSLLNKINICKDATHVAIILMGQRHLGINTNSIARLSSLSGKCRSDLQVAIKQLLDNLLMASRLQAIEANRPSVIVNINPLDSNNAAHINPVSNVSKSEAAQINTHAERLDNINISHQRGVSATPKRRHEDFRIDIHGD